MHHILWLDCYWSKSIQSIRLLCNIKVLFIQTTCNKRRSDALLMLSHWDKPIATCPLKKKLKKAGLVMRRNVPADGNCLFHAVSDQLTYLLSPTPITCRKSGFHFFVVKQLRRCHNTMINLLQQNCRPDHWCTVPPVSYFAFCSVLLHQSRGMEAPRSGHSYCNQLYYSLHY